MTLDALVRQALPFFPPEDDGMGLVQPVDGMLLLRHRDPTPLKATFYEPAVCLILQGQKETVAGDLALTITAGEALVVSHALPIVSRITQAEADTPYLAMIVTLDLSLLRQLYDEVGDARVDDGQPHALAAHAADAPLVDVLGRYLALAADPVGARVLLPLIRKELHFRLLVAPNGGMLRQLLRHDSHASNVARAVGHLRAHFRSAVSIPELASLVGMSPSSLHKHFKAVTSTTPLQYQKELRLLEARRLLAEGTHAVSTVAYEVGYESPNQFSREYARKFGVSPSQDRAATVGTGDAPPSP